MIFDESSGNSQSEDFGNLLKKAKNYNVRIPDSEDNQSEHSQNKSKRKNYSKRISSLLKVEQSEIQKTKTIKKNCVSAKMSRQRKKLYIQLLQKRAQELKDEIMKRKESIGKNRDAIMQILKETNPEKFYYIEENVKDSKNIVAQINKLKTINPDSKEPSDTEKLELMVNSYLYKFGFNGILRRDVIELLKRRWIELAINEKILMSGKQEQLQSLLNKFEHCLNNLSKKGQKLQGLFRQIHKKMGIEEVAKLIIKKQFFQSEQPPLSQKRTIEIGELEDSS